MKTGTPQEAAEAISVTTRALDELNFRQRLYNAVVRSLNQMNEKETIIQPGRRYELRQLIRSLVRLGIK